MGGKDSEGTRKTASPVTPNGSRLETNIFRSGRLLSRSAAKRGAGIQHVLAVVEDDQRLAFLEEEDQAVTQRAAGILAHTEHVGEGALDEERIGEGGDLDEPDPVGEIIEELFGGRRLPGGSCRHRRGR